MNRLIRSIPAGVGFALLLTSMPAAGQGVVNVDCSVQVEWCTLAANEFEKETGAKVAMTRRARVKPRADRGREGQPEGRRLVGRDRRSASAGRRGGADRGLYIAEAGAAGLGGEAAHGCGRPTVGIYAGALGFGYNKELLAAKGLPEPKCWADLIKPEFKGEIQMANPNSSGTAYTALATFVQMMGEDKAFDFLKQLHANINQYTKSGSAPIKAAAQGETAVGIVFQHDAVTMALSGAPIGGSPCEGTGYEIGSMSIIKGARNPEMAKKFYDFALRADIQSLADAKAYQVPSNKATPPPPEAPDFASIKLIDYDFAKYGSADERTRLLRKSGRTKSTRCRNDVMRRARPPAGIRAACWSARRLGRAPALVRGRGGYPRPGVAGDGWAWDDFYAPGLFQVWHGKLVAPHALFLVLPILALRSAGSAPRRGTDPLIAAGAGGRPGGSAGIRNRAARAAVGLAAGAARARWNTPVRHGLGGGAHRDRVPVLPDAGARAARRGEGRRVRRGRIGWSWRWSCCSSSIRP